MINVPLLPTFSSVVSAPAEPKLIKQKNKLSHKHRLRFIALSSMRKNFAEKLLCSGRLRRRKEFSRFVNFDDLSLVHEDDAMGDPPGEAHFMGDHDHRHPITSEIGHDFQNFIDHF